MPALPSSVLEPLWVQVSALLPTHSDSHPLGCHRPRIADRVIFDKLIQVLVFGCGYRRIADHTCSATTLAVPPISRRVGYLAPVGEARLPEAMLMWYASSYLSGLSQPSSRWMRWGLYQPSM